MAFEAARLKVQRAQQHISELNQLLNVFRDTDFYRADINRDIEAFQSIFIRVTKTLPPETALIVGDALHNLRAALDMVAYETVATITPNFSKLDKVNFPFSDNRQNLIGTGPYRAINEAVPEVAAFIADTIKPYETGNRTLWGLHKLDILDKHRLLIPALQMSAIHTPYRTKDGKDVEDTTLLLEGMLTGTVIRIPADCEIKGHRPTLAVFFAQGSPVVGDVISFLCLGVLELQRTINTFEKARYGSRN